MGKPSKIGKNQILGCSIWKKILEKSHQGEPKIMYFMNEGMFLYAPKQMAFQHHLQFVQNHAHNLDKKIPFLETLLEPVNFPRP